MRVFGFAGYSGSGKTTLIEQLARLSPGDLVLVEGYEFANIPKIEVHRAGQGKPLLHPSDPTIVAAAGDTPLAIPLPHLDLNDHGTIAAFVSDHRGGAGAFPLMPGSLR